MKSFNLTAILALCLAASLAACGGGGDGDDDGDSIEVCEGGACTSVSEDTKGNFTVGTYTTEDATNLPDVSVDEDTLNATCSGDETTEGGFKYFRCNLTGSSDMGVDCFRGIVYAFTFDDEGNAYENYTSSGCPSIDFYCDDYGFYPAEVCGSYVESLVKGDDSSEEAPVNDITELFETVE